ncbi:MAG: hypothetical protein ACMUIU_15915, partial [bacterium]
PLENPCCTSVFREGKFHFLPYIENPVSKQNISLTSSNDNAIIYGLKKKTTITKHLILTTKLVID